LSFPKILFKNIYIYIYIYIYIITLACLQNILKSYIHFDQKVVLFDLRPWKCVINEDRRYSLILGGYVSRDPITSIYILREARINLVLFDLRSWKCVLNEDRRYSLILGGYVSRDPITPSYILREARINF